MSVARPRNAIRLSEASGLEFILADRRSFRVPEPTRLKIRRCEELQAERDAIAKRRQAIAKRPDGSSRVEVVVESSEPAGEAPGLETLEQLRAAQLAILAEGSEPAMDVATLTPVESEQIVWALVATSFGHDPALAVQICQAHIRHAQEEAA